MNIFLKRFALSMGFCLFTSILFSQVATPGRVSPSTDVNTLLQNGFYGLDGPNPNRPLNFGYVPLLSVNNIDVGLQMSGGYVTDNLYFRGWYSYGSTFTPWRTVLHNGNVASYALPIGGGTLTGTLIGTAATFSGNLSVLSESINNSLLIGTVNPATASGYALAVNGSAIFTKAVIKATSTSWPDYVFEKDYKLQSLSEIEKYIDNNKHLPDVPSAEEVHKNGLDLGNTQSILLKKIEELTLFLIDQNKSLEKLKSDKLDQQRNIEDLQTKLKTLETSHAGFKK